MKTLLCAFALMLTMVACNKDAKTEYAEERQEANREFNDEVRENQVDIQEAADERAEHLNEAGEDLREEQTEEMDR
ncbi:MAG: hypothetical protein V4598_06035 [Bdellovibrionota bacterium]